MLAVPDAVEFCCPSKGVWKDKECRNLRLLMDGRPLNDITITDGYPMPRADELIEMMSGRKFYTVIDLKSAYWQIAYDKASCRKACIHTPKGILNYTVMVMGLKN